MKVKPGVLLDAAMPWALAIGWTALLCVLLLQPEQDPLIPTGLPSGPNTPARELAFTLLHLFAFGLTCALWFGALRQRFAFQPSIAMALGIAVVIGCLTEALQSLAPDRYPSWGDLLANWAGARLASQLIRVRRERRSRRAP